MKELTIEQEQKYQLETLKKFDSICRKEELKYFLAYGTLLGAAREQGFIKWDDDIDLWMLRKDIDRFVEVYKNYTDDRYFLQTYHTDPNMPVPGMVRLCINETYKWPLECKKLPFHTGIYFDIFPLDYCDLDIEKTKKRIKKCRLLYDMLWKKLHTKERKKSLKSMVYQTLCDLTPRRLIVKTISNCFCPSNPDYRRMVCYPVSFIYPDNIYDASLFSDSVLLQFEDIQCPCPIGYKKLLEDRYGNWEVPAITKPNRIIAYIK